MERFPTAQVLVRAINPQEPVTCFRPDAARRASCLFLDQFPGETLYAVKTNPDPAILDAVYNAGIRRFDVASLSEISLIAERFPAAQMGFMHPVKNRDAIARAYFEFGVRVFAFDSDAELDKIIAATSYASDLSLLLRLAVPNRHAAHALGEKFGLAPAKAWALLVRARSLCARLGVCFHVGSQCVDPSAYGIALRVVDNVIRRSGVLLDVVDIGGGFPIGYPGQTPPPLESYFGEIKSALSALPLGEQAEIWCEPGRALAAEAGSTIVRVDGRKGEHLYINDGTYGGLFDAGVPGFRYPVRCLRSDAAPAMLPFSFYGPTCDSLDAMAGPFLLPADIDEGDYIEIGLTGAYGAALRTPFNGFDRTLQAVLEDAPMSCPDATPAHLAPLKAS